MSINPSTIIIKDTKKYTIVVTPLTTAILLAIHYAFFPSTNAHHPNPPALGPLTPSTTKTELARWITGNHSSLLSFLRSVEAAIKTSPPSRVSPISITKLKMSKIPMTIME